MRSVAVAVWLRVLVQGPVHAEERLEAPMRFGRVNEARVLGMPAFEDSLSPEDAEPIRAYVIEQAWKLYEGEER